MPEVSFGKTTLMLLIIVALAAPAFAVTLSGHISDPANQPVADAQVRIYFVFNGVPNELYRDTTDSNGNYSFPNVNPNTYDLAFRPRSSAGLVAVYETAININTDMVINQSLEEGIYLNGTIVDEFSNPIEDIDLNVYDQSTGFKYYTPGDNSDVDGFYEVVIPTGIRRLAYRYRGTDPNARYVPVELNNVVINADTTVDIMMSVGFLVSGFVRDPNNDPVIGADLDADNSVTHIAVYTPGDNTDSTGHYEMLVPPGNYDINVAPVSSTGLIPEIVYNYPVSSDAVLNFNLQWGNTISGTVRDPGAIGVYNVNIDVQDRSTGLDLFTPWDRTDSSGFYEMVIPTGIYNIDFKPVVTPPYLACYRENALGVNGDVTLDVTVPSGILLWGTVERTSGLPIYNADIDAIDVSTDVSVPLTGDNTDSLGAYGTVVVPGTYNIEYEPLREDFLESRILMNQVLNSNTQHNMVMDTAMVVSGTVTQQDGTPIQDMKVIANESVSGIEAFTPGNKTDASGYYEILVKPLTYDLTYAPDSLSGFPDTVTLPDVVVARDTTINLVYASAPAADFTGAPRTGVPPIQVNFTDLSQNSPTSWLWDFGDGNTSDQRNPSHIYETTGYFTVSLTATNSYGSDNETKQNYLFFSEGGNCGPYVIGDYNGNGSFNVADVIDAFSKLKIGYPDSYLLCDCPPGSGNFWPVAMDVNNSCNFNIADVITAYARLRTGSPELVACQFCPPGAP